MKSTRQILLCGTLAVAAAAIAPCAHAQKIYGEEGSAAATMSVDGKQLPAPPLKFGGVIKEDVKGSKCAPDAPCLNFNALLGGPLEAIAAECGFLDKFLRVVAETPLLQFIDDGNPCQESGEPACLIETTCAGNGH